jgi:hypothetical protein
MRYVFVLESCDALLTDHPTGRTECRRRALLPPAASAWRLRLQGHFAAEIGVCGLDGHAKPA